MSPGQSLFSSEWRVSWAAEVPGLLTEEEEEEDSEIDNGGARPDLEGAMAEDVEEDVEFALTEEEDDDVEVALMVEEDNEEVGLQREDWK